MAFIYQTSVLKEIANEVGLAEKNLQDQLNVSIAGSGLSYLKISRDRVAASIGDTTISSSRTSFSNKRIWIANNIEFYLFEHYFWPQYIFLFCYSQDNEKLF